MKTMFFILVTMMLASYQSHAGPNGAEGGGGFGEFKAFDTCDGNSDLGRIYMDIVMLQEPNVIARMAVFRDPNSTKPFKDITFDDLMSSKRFGPIRCEPKNNEVVRGGQQPVWSCIEEEKFRADGTISIEIYANNQNQRTGLLFEEKDGVKKIIGRFGPCTLEQ
jgi:hypothetical protein